MKILASICLAASVLAFSAAPSVAQRQYATPESAQAHCKRDTVVWLNLPTGIYHFQGTRWYGNTKSGAFVCEHEADKAGDRPARNGQ
jgi:hypothetical protein